MRARILIPALIVVAGLSTAAFGQGAPRVVVGDNPSLSGAPLYVALENGYYREAGIDVQLEMSGTSSDMVMPINSRGFTQLFLPLSRSCPPCRHCCDGHHHHRHSPLGFLLSRTPPEPFRLFGSQRQMFGAK
jgi:hypothetical protein